MEQSSFWNWVFQFYCIFSIAKFLFKKAFHWYSYFLMYISICLFIVYINLIYTFILPRSTHQSLKTLLLFKTVIDLVPMYQLGFLHLILLYAWPILLRQLRKKQKIGVWLMFYLVNNNDVRISWNSSSCAQGAVTLQTSRHSPRSYARKSNRKLPLFSSFHLGT